MVKPFWSFPFHSFSKAIYINLFLISTRDSDLECFIPPGNVSIIYRFIQYSFKNINNAFDFRITYFQNCIIEKYIQVRNPDYNSHNTPNFTFKYLSILLSIYVPIYLNIFLFIYLSIFIQFIYLFAYLSIYLSIYLSFFLSTFFSIYLSIFHQFIYVYV